jgi:hypothetical protein
MFVFSRYAFRYGKVREDVGTLGYRIQVFEIRRARLRCIIEEINDGCCCAVMWHTILRKTVRASRRMAVVDDEGFVVSPYYDKGPNFRTRQGGWHATK